MSVLEGTERQNHNKCVIRLAIYCTIFDVILICRVLEALSSDIQIPWCQLEVVKWPERQILTRNQISTANKFHTTKSTIKGPVMTDPNKKTISQIYEKTWTKYKYVYSNNRQPVLNSYQFVLETLSLDFLVKLKLNEVIIVTTYTFPRA